MTAMAKMKLWYIRRPDGADYDEYSDAVVAATTKKQAAETHPNGRTAMTEPAEDWNRTWVDPRTVIVEYIGTAKSGTKAGVVCASFHEG
jgi:hypothetical protein